MSVKTFLMFAFLACFPAVGGEVRQHALVIGINGQGLQYADRDAQAFAVFLESPQGGSFPEKNVRLLVNERADRQGILIDGIEWVGKRVRDDRAMGYDTLVYVFFAGHGEVRELTDEAYLMPWGSNLDEPQGLGIRADEFIAEIRKEIPASRLVYFLDACHSAASVMQGGRTRGASLNVYNSLDSLFKANIEKQEVSRMGFLSAQPHQLSYEDSKLRQGVFTYFVLRGLSDLEADKKPSGNEDGKVTADELIRYLEERVPKHVREMFREAPEPPTQTPQASPGYDPNAALAAKPGIPITLHLVPNQSPKKTTGSERPGTGTPAHDHADDELK